MDTRDLTGLASARGLGALLELSLSASSSGGHLIVKGSEDAASSVEVRQLDVCEEDGASSVEC